jgi:surfactin synthase thioesterase subunit
MFEPKYYEMDLLIKDLMKQIITIIDKPYILFGHSLGSRVAFEVMDGLESLGYNLPLHFIASGSNSPDINQLSPKISKLPDKEFIQELKKLNGTPNEILENKELIDLLIPLLKADFQIAESYKYSKNKKFNCDASLFDGNDDSRTTESNVDSWGHFFVHKPSLYMLDGDHFFIESNKARLLEKLMFIIQSSLQKIIRS